jgi:hypothetical protein
MNERIRELAKQCEDWYEVSDEFSEMEFDVEKFTQLIVAECMKLNCKELSITAIERLLPLYKEHFVVE